MLTKSFLTIFLVYLPVVMSTLTFTQTHEYTNQDLKNILKLGKLYKDEVITVRFQYNASTPIYPTLVYFYKKIGLEKQTKEHYDFQNCITALCVVNLKAADSQQDYFLQISGQRQQYTTGAVQPYGKLRVTGDNKNRTNPEILKITHVSNSMRSYRIYIPTTQDYNISQVVYDIAQQSYYQGPLHVILHKQISGFNFGPRIKISKFSYQGNLMISTFVGLTPGFYWIYNKHEKSAPGTNGNWKSILTYTTQPYQCLYDKFYPDLERHFQGCFWKDVQSSDFQCLSYDNVNQNCLTCSKGFILTNGRCYDVPCPTGQYKRYGFCYPNPVGCEFYNEFTKCTKCSANYQLVNNLCERIPLICSGRTFYNASAYECTPVDPKCNNFDPKTGDCINCISSAQYLLNGKCYDATCTDRQFVLNGACYEVGSTCLVFQKIGGKCTGCAFGFTLSSDFKCVKINCPDRHVVNNFGNCIRVTDLCIVYNEKGACLQCIPTHINTVSGECLQIYKPFTCLGRQYLGKDGRCYEASPFCDIYNNGVCVKCVQNYFLLPSGDCVQQIYCNSRQYLLNNVCVDVSPSCGQFDSSNGKCLTCVNFDYQLFYGVCALKKRCGYRQWTDANGNCVDVSSKCGTFSSTNGKCLDCASGFNYFDGLCCANGQYKVNGQCVPAPSILTDGCRVKNEVFGCIQCFKYFKINLDNSGYGYCTPL